MKLDAIIKNYLELERIPYTDLSEIPMQERDQWILADLTKTRK
jgi:hypothetical protein